VNHAPQNREIKADQNRTIKLKRINQVNVHCKFRPFRLPTSVKSQHISDDKP